MNRQRLGNLLIYGTAGLLIVTGGMHLSVFGHINGIAQSATPADVQALMPPLWLAIGVDLIATGIIVALVGLENSNGGRYVLFAAAICPWGVAVLQLIYLGFIPPTAILLLDGALAIAAAVVREPRRRRSTTGA
jgi:hypothetical protein